MTNTQWRKEPPTEQECIKYTHWWFRGRVTAESAGYGQHRGEEISAMVAGIYWRDGIVTLSAGDWAVNTTEVEGEWAPCIPPGDFTIREEFINEYCTALKTWATLAVKKRIISDAEHSHVKLSITKS